MLEPTVWVTTQLPAATGVRHDFMSYSVHTGLMTSGLTLFSFRSVFMASAGYQLNHYLEELFLLRYSTSAPQPPETPFQSPGLGRTEFPLLLLASCGTKLNTRDQTHARRKKGKIQHQPPRRSHHRGTNLIYSHLSKSLAFRPRACSSVPSLINSSPRAGLLFITP